VMHFLNDSSLTDNMQSEFLALHNDLRRDADQASAKAILELI